MPSVGHVQSSRPLYYDRTMVSRTSYYSSGAIAPHGITERWTYTVPTGKKAFVQSLLAVAQRITAAAPVSQYAALVTVTPNGGTLARVLLALLLTNNVGDSAREHYGASGALAAGDVLASSTVDLSTGGTVDYNLSAWYIEFDA